MIDLIINDNCIIEVKTYKEASEFTKHLTGIITFDSNTYQNELVLRFTEKEKK